MPKNDFVHLTATLKKLPDTPGVYQFFNEKEEIIYIGKAKNLKNRVKSYFQNSTEISPKTAKMIEKIARLQWIETRSETEALLLEANLVHEHLPRFNVLLRDDKKFLYVRIAREPFSNVETTRFFQKDGAVYFGPFTSSKKIRTLLDFAREVLRFRMCKVEISAEGKAIRNPENRKIPCIDFQIARCSAPCSARISSEEYAKSIDLLKDFLRGNSSSIKKIVQEKMMTAAGEKKFETAARLRDILFSLESFGQKQIADAAADFSADAIGFCSGVHKSFFAIFSIRQGKILRVENVSLHSAETPSATISAFLRDFPQIFPEIPPLFLVSDFSEKELFSEFFSEIAGKKIEIRVPERGIGRDLLDLANKNAAVFAANSRASFEKVDVLAALQNALGLSVRPERIECYDISHLSGTHTVGSRVVFIGGKPAKSEYRHYKIRSLAEGQIDDFSAMAEMIGRRLKRLIHEEEALLFEKESDLSAIETISQEMAENQLPVFPFPEKQFVFREKTTGHIAGFARLKKIGKLFEIGGVLVREEFRERGFGTDIVKTLVAHSEEKILRIIVKKKKNLRWYISMKAIGFRPESKPPQSFSELMAERTKNDGEERACLKISPCDFRKTAQKYPDLMVIDGGKGQLSAVVAVLKKMNLFEKIPVCSLAKREEEIFLPEKSEPLPILKSAPENELLQNIRDEAHRFAIAFNRSSREKSAISSSLDAFFSQKTKMVLLRKFGSPDAVFSAKDEELREILSESEIQKMRKKKSH